MAPQEGFVVKDECEHISLWMSKNFNHVAGDSRLESGRKGTDQVCFNTLCTEM